jgi:hypothetical protein
MSIPVPEDDLPDELKAKKPAGEPVPDSDIPFELKHPVAGEALDIAKGLGKGAVQRVMGVPGMAADALYAASNLGGKGVNKLVGKKIFDENLEMPTAALDREMSALVGPTKTKTGKVAEFLAGIGPTAKGVESAERALFSMTSAQAAQRAISGLPMPEAERLARQAVDSGYKIPPSELPNAPVGRAVQSAAGKARAEEEMSAHNWKRTQELARNEFHLPEGTEFTDATFDKLEQPGYDTYEELRAINKGQPFNVTLTYLKAVGRAGEEGGAAAHDFPGAPDSRVLALRGQYGQGQFTAPGAVAKIKELRNTWRQLSRSLKPEDKSFAQANKDIADALENELGEAAQRGGNPGLLSEFQNARQYLARVFAVRDATGIDGQVSARALAGMLPKTKLTGNLKIIAESAAQHPKAFQDVQKKGRMGPYTVHDAWALMAGAGSAVFGAHAHAMSPTGAAVVGAAAGSAARPIARAALGTQAAQKFMTRPSSKKIVNKFVREHGTVGNIAGAVNASSSDDLGDNGP